MSGKKAVFESAQKPARGQVQTAKPITAMIVLTLELAIVMLMFRLSK